MIHFIPMLFACAQAPGQATPQPMPPAPRTAAAEAPPAPETLVVQPWQDGVDAGFAQIRASAAQQQFDSARAVADALLAPNSFLRWKLDFAGRGGWRARSVDFVDPLLDRMGWNGLDENARAEVWYAKAVVDALAGARPAAADSFEKARAGAHDKSLRHDAIYDLGVLALEQGEELRATIPEISGKPPAPPPPPPAATPGAPPAEPPDPLQLARAAYMNAREHFVERLKSDWNDADTQADVELCLKRLRELDDIEKKREEQKKQEEQQKKDQKDKQDQQKKDDQQKQDQKDKQDPDKQPDAGKNDSKDDPKPKDPKEDEKPDQKKPEDPKPKDAKEDQAKKDESKQAQPTEKKEQQLSREEMTQLFDRLDQLEQEAQKIQAQLKAARHGKVKKDW